MPDKPAVNEIEIAVAKARAMALVAWEDRLWRERDLAFLETISEWRQVLKRQRKIDRQEKVFRIQERLKRESPKQVARLEKALSRSANRMAADYWNQVWKRMRATGCKWDTRTQNFTFACQNAHPTANATHKLPVDKLPGFLKPTFARHGPLSFHRSYASECLCP